MYIEGLCANCAYRKDCKEWRAWMRVEFCEGFYPDANSMERKGEDSHGKS